SCIYKKGVHTTQLIKCVCINGYKWVCWKVWLCRIGAVCSLGLLLVLFNWRPRLGILARCKSCPISMADVLLLKVLKFVSLRL
uniref:Cation-transporting ATPase n=1 Tax=Sinocyclocheilus grahami TaxID=75366 RepID=A0A672K4X8_SINGR